MISSLDPSSVSFLNGLNIIQRRSQRAQLELTTGLKINAVEDSPSDIPQLLQTQSAINRSEQIASNLTQVKLEVDTGEGSLSSAVTLLQQAQTLGTQGQSGFLSAASRQQISGQLDDVLKQLVGIANTSVSGRFIFAGDSDQTTPYKLDLTQPAPVSAYQGSASTRQVEHPDGTLFAVAKTAQQIFDSADPTQNVFQTVNNLRTALTNNDQTGINAALGGLQTASTYLNTQLTFYGGAQNRVADGISTGATLTTQLKTRLSGLQDADATQAITEFQQASIQQQAALASRAKIPRSSLFDYLG